MKFRLMLIVLALQLSSCVKERLKTRNNFAGEDRESSINKTVEDSTGTALITNGFNSKSPYYSFIEKKYSKILKEKKLIYFEEKDIDLDGKKEAVAAFGSISEKKEADVDCLFLLRNDNEKIVQLACNFGFGDYNIYDVKLISLKGKKQSYINLYLSNGSLYFFGLRGFSVFELVNNHPKQICFSYSKALYRSDKLIDSDKDEVYDGYVQHEIKDYTLKYFGDTQFVFENDVFKPKETQFTMDDYPDSIKGVLLQYIRIRSLDFVDDMLSDRLKKLCVDSKLTTVLWNRKVWDNAYYKSYYDANNAIKFEINKGFDVARVLVTHQVEVYNKKKKKKYQLQFDLQKISNCWRIADIMVIE
jgi:hypothetical protein